MEHLIPQTITDLVQLALVAICGYLVKYLREHLTQPQIDKAVQIAQIAVKAAEAIGAANGFDGKAKFQQALEMARTLAASHSIKFTDEEWQALIEAAVHTLKAGYDELKKEGT